ncbi:MAG: purine-nucleoside phosphorylase [Anaerolineaceae bacterium]|nr:purine-nucleoside phosphorylase [Anaerolineaceae bacterium]
MSFLNSAPTPHNSAKPGEIAENILLPGDPLRAKFIAENFLDNAVCYNSVRNMLGFTGTYKGKRISVQGTGMGMPSMAIYSYELIHFYGCKNLMRIGTCGTISDELDVNDIVIGMGACHDSNMEEQFQLPGKYAPLCSFELLEKTVSTARRLNMHFMVGNILSSSLFYSENRTDRKDWKTMGILAAEMEAAALYMNAAFAGVNALAVLTVSDSARTGKTATVEERETGTAQMVKLALETMAGLS